MLVIAQSQLEQLCYKLIKEESIALDTEFVRRDTYYPKLSLIQVAGKNFTAIIDATALDLKPFKDILLNQCLLKIFHAPKQDFEIFYHLFNIIPINFFDTQIAASCSNIKNVASYADLCLNICNVYIDKSHQAADWLTRPIADEMIEYAIRDVEYLHDLYEYLNPLIIDPNFYHQRLNCELADPNLYKFNPQKAWKKIKIGLKPDEFIEKMKVLAAFREEEAAKLNVPRGHFISDQTLIQICSILPKNEKGWKGIERKSKWMKNISKKS